jgi:hypothetical protein
MVQTMMVHFEFPNDHIEPIFCWFAGGVLKTNRLAGLAQSGIWVSGCVMGAGDRERSWR